ncbi:DUF4129 domain-containing protein [Dermatobacter hominis]|uniref:DUF4129 domain-containing protein n=1 Tax=Dermatobacter hominis TaxID=2884263 RepID=UPI001D0FB6C9|nr:DUF4129 domain-containing protein [Dermatobacter hominis]UDY37142.1 DUF4129 domain-containing protein [Dermatobacter hominis]
MASGPERLQGHVPPRRHRSVLLLLAVAVLVAVVGPLSGGAGALGPGRAPDRQGADPQGPAQPAEVREDVRDVMDRPEFDYEPSWFERALEWIGDQLSKLFEPGEGEVGGGTFGGGIGALFGWLLLVLAGVAAIGVLVWVVATRTRRVRRAAEDPLTPAEVEHRRRPEEWMADAERFEAEGAWKEAVRARYRNLVRVLVDRRQLPDVRGRTTGELRGDLDRTTPAAHDDFDTCCLLFELPWYADVPTGPDESARFRQAAERVLAATANDRFDAVTLFDVTGVEREVVDVAAAPGPSEGDG